MDNYSDKSKEQLIAEIESLKVQVQTNQKQADQKASDGDELYRIIADFSDDLIAITSFDKNSKYIYVSPSHKRSLGYSEEEMLGKSGFDFVHPADKSKLFVLLKSYLKKKLTKVFTGKEIDTVEKIVYRVKHKNGHWITIESIAKVIDKNKVLFFSRDLTDNIKAGMSLKNSEEKFRNAFHTSPDSVCINRLVDGMYVEINAGFTNILGYHKRDVEGRTSQELNIWADVNDRKKLLAGLKKNGIVENMEARFVNKSGDTKIGLMSASIIDLFGEDHILSITRDVTEHKELRRDWENIFMAISAPTVILDTNFRILEANRATLELSGLPVDEIYGKHCYEVFHKKGNDCPADGCPLKKILEKADNRTVEMEMEAFDGTYLVNCTPILDEVGNVEKIIHIATNITEIKTFEKRLKQSEEKYKHLAENASDIIFTTDANGNFVYANDTAVLKTGYSQKELMKMSYQDLISPEYQQKAKRFYMRQILAKTLVSNFEYPFKNKDGKVIWYSQNATLITDQDEVLGFHLFSRDITEKKAAELALIESERLKFLILEATTDSITFYDKDFNILMLNSKSGIGLNVSHETLLNKKCYQAFCQSNSPCEGCAALKAFDTGEIQTKEKLIDEKYLYEFRYYPVKNEKNEIIGTVEFGKNITDLKEIENALKQSERNYKNLVEKLPNGVLIHKNNKIVFANYSGAKMLGANSAQEVLGADISKFLLADKQLEAQDRVNKLADGRKDVNPIEEQYKRLDGNLIDLEVYASVIEFEGGKAYQHVLHDITDRKKVLGEINTYRYGLEEIVAERTQELKKQAKKLSESQKALTFLLEDSNEVRIQLERANLNLSSLNSELESFSYSVSHDLRAPLTRMDGFSKALIEDYGDQVDETANHYLNRIRVSSQHMASLIDDLLNLSRITRQQVVKTNVNITSLSNKVVEDILELYPNYQIEFNIEENLTVNADNRLMKVLLTNLIGNAAKFSHKVDNAKIIIGKTKIDNTDTIFLQDNGVGFNMKYFGQIFSPFNRLHSDKEYAGSGVGLAIVQRIINKHAGRIWAESEEGKGSTFYFQL